MSVIIPQVPVSLDVPRRASPGGRQASHAPRDGPARRGSPALPLPPGTSMGAYRDRAPRSISISRYRLYRCSMPSISAGILPCPASGSPDPAWNIQAFPSCGGIPGRPVPFRRHNAANSYNTKDSLYRGEGRPAARTGFSAGWGIRAPFPPQTPPVQQIHSLSDMTVPRWAVPRCLPQGYSSRCVTRSRRGFPYPPKLRYPAREKRPKKEKKRKESRKSHPVPEGIPGQEGKDADVRCLSGGKQGISRVRAGIPPFAWNR